MEFLVEYTLTGIVVVGREARTKVARIEKAPLPLELIALTLY